MTKTYVQMVGHLLGQAIGQETLETFPRSQETISSKSLDAEGQAYGEGNVFRLTRSADAWTSTSLHDFCADGLPCSDGYRPSGKLALDPAGNIYGTSRTCSQIQNANHLGNRRVSVTA